MLKPSMEDSVRRLLDAYPAIFVACHRRHLREDHAGNVLTEKQISVLNHLHMERATTPSVLAEHLGVSRATVSVAVAKLARRGYIERGQSEGDGRSIGLRLTPAGVRVKEENTVLDPELVKAVFAVMPAAELREALEGVERLAKYAWILLRQRKRGMDR
jgi:DNA-binding MarR family transcriptional regulator